MNGWMVFVEKSRAPKRIHETIEIAQGEADRLSKLAPHKKVYILEIVSVIEPTAVSDPKITLTVTMDKEVAELLNKANIKVKTSNTLSLPKKGVVK